MLYVESNILFYTLSLMICYYLCYERELNLKGLWIGWIIGLTVNSAFSLYLLLTNKEKKKTFSSQQSEIIEGDQGITRIK
jgi:Na+-driven multidrug efflux pump